MTKETMTPEKAVEVLKEELLWNVTGGNVVKAEALSLAIASLKATPPTESLPEFITCKKCKQENCRNNTHCINCHEPLTPTPNSEREAVLEKLREVDEAAFIHDGTLEQLNEALKIVWPDDPIIAAGAGKYYYSERYNRKMWDSSNKTRASVLVTVTEFLRLYEGAK